MSGLALGLFLALAASVTQSSGFLAQHVRAGDRPPVTPRHPLKVLRSMFASRWWLFGLGLGGVGFAVHVAALALAPLSLVQAFLAGGLALAAPLAAIVFRQRLTTVERRSVVLMAAALFLLALGGSSRGGHSFDGLRLAVYLTVILGVAALAVALFKGARRYAFLAIAAGAFYGVLDSSLKAMTELARRGGAGAVIHSPWWALAAVAIFAAFFCFQRALQTNRGLTAIALMEAGADSTAIVAGFIAFGDSIGPGAPLTALHAAAFVAVGIAAWSLAPVQQRVSQASATVTPAGEGGRGAGMSQPAAGEPQRQRHLAAPKAPAVGAWEAQRPH
jgi:hypothetical protein